MTTTTTTATFVGCGDGVLAAGEECDDGNMVDDDGCTAACTKGGVMLWQQQNDPEVIFYYDVTTDADGNIYAAGYQGKFGSETYQIAVKKLDPSGNTIWTKLWNSPGGVWEVAYEVAVDAKGRVFVAGYQELPMEVNTMVAALDGATGNVLWTKIIDQDGPNAKGNDFAASIAIGPDGKLVVAGGAGGTLPTEGIWYFKMDPDTQAFIWSNVIQFPQNNGYGDFADDVAIDAQGNIAVAAEFLNNGQKDIWVRKCSPDGAELWTKTYDGPAHALDNPGSVAFDPDGNIVVVGTIQMDAKNFDMWIRKYGLDGTDLWTKGVDGGGINADVASNVAIDAYGNIVVGSRYCPKVDLDVWIRKYSPKGDEIWTRTVSTPDIDQVYGVAIDPKKNIIVAGQLGAPIWLAKLTP